MINNQGVLVAHPSLEGQSLWNVKAPDGTMVGRRLVSAGEAGGGFVTYTWPLPNSKKTEKKIVYVAKDPAGWGWNVAAGSYMSDYNAGADQILRYLFITVLLALMIGS